MLFRSSRFQSLVHPVRAIVAFRCGIGKGINVERVIRTGLHTRLAADAGGGIEVDNTVVPAEKRFRGTDRHARRVITLVAPQNGKVAAGIGKGPFLDIFYPGAEGAKRNLVFRFAGNGTGMASDAPGLINNEPISHEDQCADPGWMSSTKFHVHVCIAPKRNPVQNMTASYIFSIKFNFNTIWKEMR